MGRCPARRHRAAAGARAQGLSSSQLLTTRVHTHVHAYLGTNERGVGVLGRLPCVAGELLVAPAAVPLLNELAL